MSTTSGHIERTFTFGPGATPHIVAHDRSGVLAMSGITIHGEVREDVAVVVVVESPDALDRGLEIRIVQEGDTVTVEPIRGGGLLAFGAKTTAVTVDIRTPHRSDATVRADSASVHVSDLTGRTVVETGSGNVQVHGLRGSVEIKGGSGVVRGDDLHDGVRISTGSGDIKAHDLQGDVQIRSGSGSISLEGGMGAFTLQGASGSVRLRRLTGTLDCMGASGSVRAVACTFSRAHVRTASGGIRLASSLDPAGDYRFETASGHVELQVPEGTRATVTYTTMSGGISSDLPHERDRSKRSGTLRVNGGGASVTMRSASGGLAVRTATDALPVTAPAPTTDAPVTAPAPSLPAPESPPESPPEEEPSETLRILHAVERGELDIDTAMARLAALEEAETVS